VPTAISCWSIAVEMMTDASDGKNNAEIVGNAEICPLIHSIVVVTSPIGVHAPPAFAAITIKAPNSFRSSASGRIFLMRET